MNCLDTRRALLAAPHERSSEQDAHIGNCSECARLAGKLDELDARIADAALVPVPDALAERILLGRASRPRWQHYATAAAVLLALTLGFAGPRLWDESTLSNPVQAVGPTHPAVTAIGVVVDQQPALLDEAHGIDIATMEDALRRLGLSLKKDQATVDYAAKCYMPDTECEHLVLDTMHGKVSVILVPDYPLGARALVADRRMTALVSPAGSGGYIVVAGSPKAAKRAEKLFVRG